VISSEKGRDNRAKGLRSSTDKQRRSSTRASERSLQERMGGREVINSIARGFAGGGNSNLTRKNHL